MLTKDHFNKEEVSLWPLFLFSVPSILSSLLEPMASIVDTALVGNKYTEWLGALAVATIIFNAFTWVFNFLVHVSTQQIGNNLGRGDKKSAVGALQISLVLSLALGLVTIVLLLSFKEQLYFLAGGRVEYKEELDAYFTFRLLGQPVVLIAYTLLSALRAYKLIKFSFIALICSTLTNIIISWLMLYHFNYGMYGVAFGTVFAHLFVCILAFVRLNKIEEIRNYLFRIPLKSLSWGSFSKTSWFFFGRSLALTSMFFISNKLAANIGVIEIAGHQVVIQAWLFASFFIDGLAITANVLGSRYIGANQTSMFHNLTMNLSILSIVIGVMFTIIYFVADISILNLFSNESDLINHILTYWWLVASTQVINSLSFMVDGLLYGAGYFRFIRNLMWGAFIFAFIPFAITAYSTGNYLYILISLISVNGVRCVFGYAKIFKSLSANH